MRDSIKSFECHLKWRINTLTSALETKYKKYEQTEIGSILKQPPLRNKILRKIREKTHIALKKTLRKKFDDENKVSIIKIDELKILLSYFQKGVIKPFKDSEILEKQIFLSKLSNKEQAEVIAYFVNLTICCQENLIKEELENNKRKDTKELEDNIAMIRKVISHDGSIIANSYANVSKKYAEIMENYLSKNLSRIVLEYSRELAILNYHKEDEERRNAAVKAQAKKAADEKFEKQIKLDKENKAIIATSKKEIRKYLKNDQPIKYISDDELNIVMNLLKDLNYNYAQRTEIKRLILAYNQNYLESEQQKMFNKAKNIYLESSEMTLLNIAEAILSNPESIKNPIYQEIENMYLEIKGKLLALACNPNELVITDEVDYVMLCVAELTKLISEYRSSNYKLNLTQNSN